MRNKCKIILYIIASLFCQNSFAQSSKTSVPYDSVTYDIGLISYKSWYIKRDQGNVIHLIAHESVEICNFINAYAFEKHETEKEYAKDKMVDKISFDLNIVVINKLSRDSTKKIQAKDDSIDKLILALPEKFHIAHLTHKFDDYIADNPTDSMNLVNYKREKAQLMILYQRLPDFNTKRFSVYFSDNMPMMLQPCSSDVYKKVNEKKSELEGMLKRKY